MSTRISAETALKERAKIDLLIDVRSAKGRAETGEIPEAVVIAKQSVEPLFAGPFSQLPKDTRITVFCGSIAGSGPAVESLQKLGFHNAVDVEGGYAALIKAGWS